MYVVFDFYSIILGKVTALQDIEFPQIKLVSATLPGGLIRFFEALQVFLLRHEDVLVHFKFLLNHFSWQYSHFDLEFPENELVSATSPGRLVRLS